MKKNNNIIETVTLPIAEFQQIKDAVSLSCKSINDLIDNGNNNSMFRASAGRLNFAMYYITKAEESVDASSVVNTNKPKKSKRSKQGYVRRKEQLLKKMKPLVEFAKVADEIPEGYSSLKQIATKHKISKTYAGMRLRLCGVKNVVRVGRTIFVENKETEVALAAA